MYSSSFITTFRDKSEKKFRNSITWNNEINRWLVSSPQPDQPPHSTISGMAMEISFVTFPSTTWIKGWGRKPKWQTQPKLLRVTVRKTGQVAFLSRKQECLTAGKQASRSFAVLDLTKSNYWVMRSPLIWWAWLPNHSITTMSTVRSLGLRKVKLKMKSLLSSVFSWQCSLLAYQPTYVHMHMALVPSQNDSNTKRVSLCVNGAHEALVLNSKLYYMWPILCTDHTLDYSNWGPHYWANCWFKKICWLAVL